MSENTYDASNINIISHLEAIRKRPGMYFGDLEHGGANHVICELVANSIDQFLAGVASYVKVDIEGDRICVSDDGSGLPFDQPSEEVDISLAEHYLTQYHQTPTADGHAPHVHVGCSGIGLVAVTAVSVALQITSANGKAVWQQTYQQGKARLFRNLHGK